ncbi:putative Replication protein A 70 kDa DNA-binding subunit [Blattamonas nauphoetae]|uniref:Replication protein A 70 kDa DNA-binding subunit n=1 Tax=Blattamonas nauphoetae TaxID=2049346 RepID=A0ABQ9X228_9EUKA|nr:putative Replication protein A 70 kDa DNA-binding subunit [Blattamonas nauphoetae]
MESQLTPHAISHIANELNVVTPIVQVVGKIPANMPQAPNPYKTFISDSEEVLPCWITIEGNEDTLNSLARYNLVQLDDISVFTTNGKLTVRAGKIQIASAEVIRKIGEPHNFGLSSSKSTATTNQPTDSVRQAGNKLSTDIRHQNQVVSLQQTPMRLQNSVDPNYHLLPKTADGVVQTQPIASLTVYSHHSWCIKARVTVKSPIKEYNQRTPDSKGQILSCDLLDEDGGETRIVFFNDMVLKFKDIMEKGKVYYIHRGSIRVPTNKRFCRFDHEITAGSETVIVPFLSTPRVGGGRVSDTGAPLDDDDTIAKIKWDFVPNLAQLEPYPSDSWVDLVGIVCEVGELTDITTKYKSQLQKRTLWICDESMNKLEVTFWGEQASGPDSVPNIVNPNAGDTLSIKAARVGEFNGKNVSVGNQTLLEVNDTSNERVRQLKQWWTAEGSAFRDKLEPVKGKGGYGGRAVPRSTIRRIKDDGAGSEPGRVDLFSVIAAPVYFQRQNLMYVACPQEKCGKKLGEDMICLSCGPQSRGIMKYIVNLNVSDSSDNLWVNLFSNQAEKFIGCTAELLSDLQHRSETEYTAKLDSCLFDYHVWKIRAKLDEFNEQRRTRYTCYSFDKLDFGKESRRLVAEIAATLPEDQQDSYFIGE